MNMALVFPSTTSTSTPFSTLDLSPLEESAFEKLSAEMIDYVLSFSKIRDLKSIISTCKTFRQFFPHVLISSLQKAKALTYKELSQYRAAMYAHIKITKPDTRLWDLKSLQYNQLLLHCENLEVLDLSEMDRSLESILGYAIEESGYYHTPFDITTAYKIVRNQTEMFPSYMTFSGSTKKNLWNLHTLYFSFFDPHQTKFKVTPAHLYFFSQLFPNLRHLTFNNYLLDFGDQGLECLLQNTGLHILEFKNHCRFFRISIDPNKIPVHHSLSLLHFPFCWIKSFPTLIPSLIEKCINLKTIRISIYPEQDKDYALRQFCSHYASKCSIEILTDLIPPPVLPFSDSF